MKMLIFEGPDNLGKSTAIGQMEQILKRAGYRVHVMVQPNRKDWTEELEEYVMGSSNAVPIERQYLITQNCIAQYAKVPKDTDIILSDRHFAVSNLIYFRDGSPAADMYRRAAQESLLSLHETLGIDYTCCILLVGERPFVDADQGEHFETSTRWQDICARYNRLKYTDALPNCGIEVCAVDAWSCKGRTIDVCAGLFTYALKHGKLPQPLDAGIPTPPSEGESPSSEVSPSEEEPKCTADPGLCTACGSCHPTC